MALGKMNSFIDIIQSTPNKDAAGFADPTKPIETVVASVRAYKEERHGNKTWANRAAFSTATVMFRFRIIPDLKVNPSMLISCNGDRYRILSAEDVRGRGMYMEVLAERIEPSKG